MPSYHVTKAIEHHTTTTDSTLDLEQTTALSDHRYGYYSPGVLDHGAAYRPTSRPVHATSTVVSDEVREAMVPHTSNLYASRLRSSGTPTTHATRALSPLSSYSGDYAIGYTPSRNGYTSSVDGYAPFEGYRRFTGADYDASNRSGSRLYDRDLSPSTSYRELSLAPSRSSRYRSLSTPTSPLRPVTPPSIGYTAPYTRQYKAPRSKRESSVTSGYSPRTVGGGGHYYRERTTSTSSSSTSSSQWCNTGGVVKVTCIAETASGQKFTWYHDGVQLADGSKYCITVSNGYRSYLPDYDGRY